MDGDDYAVVFSTYRWGDNVERPQQVPSLVFYSLKTQTIAEQIKSALVLLQYDQETK